VVDPGTVADYCRIPGGWETVPAGRRNGWVGMEWVAGAAAAVGGKNRGISCGGGAGGGAPAWSCVR
jgi:hypothetical protein